MFNRIIKASKAFGSIMAGGYDVGSSDRYRRDLGWGKRSELDEDHLVGDNTRMLSRKKAEDLRRNDAVVSGVCERLALFTCGATGILPQARTSDTGWNRAAEQFFADYSLLCDSRKRSTLFDFQNMAVSLRPTHGGLYFQKLEDGTIRPIECERIRQPKEQSQQGGYCEGVKVNSTTGEIETYRVHSRDKEGGFSGDHAEQPVDAKNMLAVVRSPWRPDSIREIGDLAPIIPALQDISEMNLYTRNTAKVQSMVVGFLKKIGGGGLNSFQRGTTTQTVGSRQTFKQDWGQILEGFPGDDLDMKVSPTPNQNHIPYIKLQYALCASALNMPYEFFTLDLSQLDYSRQKGMLLLVNYACRPWKRWLCDKFLSPLWNWRIAMEMGPGGELSPAPVDKNGISEWSKVEWQYPEEVWIDRQEAMQADVLEIQGGMSTLGRAIKRRGYDLEDSLRERAREIQLVNTIATEFKINPDKLVQMQIPGQVNPEQKPAPSPSKEESAPVKKEEDDGNESE